MLEYTLSIMLLMALKSERRRVRKTSLWAGTSVGVRRRSASEASSADLGLLTLLAWAPPALLPELEFAFFWEVSLESTKIAGRRGAGRLPDDGRWN